MRLNYRRKNPNRYSHTIYKFYLKYDDNKKQNIFKLIKNFIYIKFNCNQSLQFIIFLICNIAEHQQMKEDLNVQEIALKCSTFFKELSQFCANFAKSIKKQSSANDKPDKKQRTTRQAIQRSTDIKVDNLKKKKQKIVDPQLPKKPLTAYILYFQQKKPRFVDKYPDLALSELTKLIAKQWKQLKNQEKKPYLQKAALDRSRYQNQSKVYKQQYKVAGGRKRIQSKDIKDKRKISKDIEADSDDQSDLKIQEQLYSQ